MNDLWTIAWTASVPGVGPRRFTSLQQRFPDLTELLTISDEKLLKLGIPERLAQSILSHRETHSPKEIQDFCRDHGIRLLISPFVIPDINRRMKNKELPARSTTRSVAGRRIKESNEELVTEDYPELLAQISDPPVALYLKGTLPDWSKPMIAVVGTRNITSYGRNVTQTLTTQLVHAGCTIVSGFMYGVDAVAHESAVTAGGETIAVLGYGLGVPFFPRDHDKLAEKIIAGHGCLLTEFPPWQTAVPGNFPSRNRIVSGLSQGVLVTEAAQKSGSRITAGLAVDQGRCVFAIPGPMNSPYSEGTKELVNLGAKLVTSAQDIVEDLRSTISGSVRLGDQSGHSLLRTEFSSELEKQIYLYIYENAQASLEELIIYTQAEARELAQALSDLELSGVIRQDVGGVFSLSV